MSCAAAPREVPLDTYRNIGIMAHIDAGKVKRRSKHSTANFRALSHISANVGMKALVTLLIVLHCVHGLHVISEQSLCICKGIFDKASRWQYCIYDNFSNIVHQYLVIAASIPYDCLHFINV